MKRKKQKEDIFGRASTTYDRLRTPWLLDSREYAAPIISHPSVKSLLASLKDLTRGSLSQGSDILPPTKLPPQSSSPGRHFQPPAHAP